MSLSLGLASLVLAAAASSAAPCAPISGWEGVLTDERVRWVIIGEMHGNNETPAIFADAVCLTSQARKTVVVALELPSREQDAIDRFMASDGGKQAQREFLARPFWNSSSKDGRSSEAYFRLLQTLRQWRSAGRIASVIAFQPSGPSASPGEYEEAMAKLVRSAAGPGATVIATIAPSRISMMAPSPMSCSVTAGLSGRSIASRRAGVSAAMKMITAIAL